MFAKSGIKMRNLNRNSSLEFPYSINMIKCGVLTSLTVFCILSGFFTAVDGLQCYECLSLQSCRSQQVCSSIRKTMVKVFVPKGHIIHFNPDDNCPENEPTNSSSWAALSKECQRSDSVCLVSPIEIISSVDGTLSNKELEHGQLLTTSGYVRGCASRRKLQEIEDTIRVNTKILTKTQLIVTPSPTKGENTNATRSQPTSFLFGEKEVEVAESEASFDGESSQDEYRIRTIYSHIFYLDQGTGNATKCYESNCNTMVRVRSGGEGLKGSGLSILVLLVLSVFRIGSLSSVFE